MLRRLYPYIFWGFYKFLLSTWKLKIITTPEFDKRIENREPCIFAHWHGDELALLHTITRYRLCTMTSTSKDGELMNKVFHLLGGNTSRGSSTRGGVGALKGLIRLIKTGRNSSVAVDGPKGPIYKSKPGVFELAKLTKAPVFTLTAACSNAWIFEKSWNKAFLPKPFSKVIVDIGHAQFKLERGDDAKDPKRLQQLDNSLTDAKHKVTKLIAAKNC